MVKQIDIKNRNFFIIAKILTQNRRGEILNPLFSSRAIPLIAGLTAEAPSEGAANML